jgi:hypothetical protein
MTRVVFDTNVIVSALLQPLGPSAQVFVLALSVLALSGSIQLCVSGSIDPSPRIFSAICPSGRLAVWPEGQSDIQTVGWPGRYGAGAQPVMDSEGRLLGSLCGSALHQRARKADGSA